MAGLLTIKKARNQGRQTNFSFAFVNLIIYCFLMRNLGERIRTLRTEQSMSLPTLAERSGLSKGLLSKLENNEESNPSLDTLYKIVSALKVTLGDILETETAQLKKSFLRNNHRGTRVWLLICTVKARNSTRIF